MPVYYRRKPWKTLSFPGFYALPRSLSLGALAAEVGGVFGQRRFRVNVGRIDDAGVNADAAALQLGGLILRGLAVPITPSPLAACLGCNIESTR